MQLNPCFVGSAMLAFSAAALAGDMQRVGTFEIDRTEVSVAEFAKFVQATGLKTQAEISGGNTFEGGWQQRTGWHWRTPFGKPARGDEPAVHINHSEARQFCQWAGKRLPTDAQWGQAAYTETRAQPSDGFETGKTYTYPVGARPEGVNCLGDCGAPSGLAFAETSRGQGHARVGQSKRGVNGLFDMGGNVWEWVEASGPDQEPRTRGGSWWYGAESMRDAHRMSKPASMSAVYIGFRCAKSASGGVR